MATASSNEALASEGLLEPPDCATIARLLNAGPEEEEATLDAVSAHNSFIDSDNEDPPPITFATLRRAKSTSQDLLRMHLLRMHLLHTTCPHPSVTAMARQLTAFMEPHGIGVNTFTLIATILLPELIKFIKTALPDKPPLAQPSSRPFSTPSDAHQTLFNILQAIIDAQHPLDLADALHNTLTNEVQFNPVREPTPSFEADE